MNVMIINNTGSDIRMFDSVFTDCLKNNLPLPEEISDIFTLDIIKVDEQLRGIVNFI